MLLPPLSGVLANMGGARVTSLVRGEAGLLSLLRGEAGLRAPDSTKKRTDVIQ